eukprot:SAG11_NODE_6447_length_1311_cov_1.396865_1_plen_64_part_00
MMNEDLGIDDVNVRGRGGAKIVRGFHYRSKNLKIRIEGLDLIVNLLTNLRTEYVDRRVMRDHQ